MSEIQATTEPTRTFEELECWKSCRDFRKWIVQCVLPLLPKSEQFRLYDQLIRAARSTTANIAEGHGRFHYRDNVKFCRQARGSLFEVLDHIIAGVDENLIDPAVLADARTRFNAALRILNGYINWLRRASEAST